MGDVSFVKFRCGVFRLLLWLVVVNLVNYGRLCELFCVEVLFVVLLICGEDEIANLLFGKFKWGYVFLLFNKEFFKVYFECKDSVEIILV